MHHREKPPPDLPSVLLHLRHQRTYYKAPAANEVSNYLIRCLMDNTVFLKI